MPFATKLWVPAISKSHTCSAGRRSMEMMRSQAARPLAAPPPCTATSCPSRMPDTFAHRPSPGFIALSSGSVLYLPRMANLSVDQIERAIEKSRPEDQQRLLARLPKLIGLSAEDLAYLRLAESSLGFWDNEKDSIYDRL